MNFVLTWLNHRADIFPRRRWRWRVWRRRRRWLEMLFERDGTVVDRIYQAKGAEMGSPCVENGHYDIQLGVDL